MMTDNNSSTPRSSFSPQSIERTLRIDGERSSAFFNTAIRVARLDSRLRELAGVQNPDARKAYRQACEAYSKAIGMFEDELTSIERDLGATRRGPRNAGAGNNANRPRRDKKPPQNGNQGNKPSPTPASGNAKSNQQEQKPDQPLEAKEQKQPREAKPQKQQPAAKKQKPSGPQQPAGQAVAETGAQANAEHSSNAGVMGAAALSESPAPAAQPAESTSPAEAAVL
ncbi:MULTISPECIES: hypothetical protein [Stutzerimonas stutzeri group]|jgi:hypothetical protein|uniref:Uncharacterized protein n=1 Tax=Stutzerimonas stutzeri TaxID=316 RepID=A0AA40RV42_STUST|nr:MULTISPECIES: hypothetical protein [Stutzerimonas stutzeri group]MBA1305970.1 hypothetical protein [Stutzerimonas stutzeri]MBK3920016.1 hypothetical protein [Stutzerimonas frequens]